MKDSSLYSAMDIREVIGQLADGCFIQPELFECVRESILSGQCLTADRGMQQFVVDIEGCSLRNRSFSTF